MSLIYSMFDMFIAIISIIGALLPILIFIFIFSICFIGVKKLLISIFPKIFDTTYIAKKESIFGEYIDYLYKKDYLMTKRENEFFRNLCDYIKDKDYLVCPKVRLEDIVGVRNTRSGLRPWKASSRLDRAHVDFLLIGKNDYLSKFAIELDDSTHDNEYGKVHDRAKNEAFEKVGMPILRFRNSNTTHEEFASAGI